MILILGCGLRQVGRGKLGFGGLGFEGFYFHRGQTTTGRLSSNTNTAEGTLTQESGDVRSVEGEVCGAVLVDE